MKKVLLQDRTAWLWLALGVLMTLCVVVSTHQYEQSLQQAQLNRNLIDAVTGDQLQTVQALLGEGADPNARQLPDTPPPPFWEFLKTKVVHLWRRQHSASQDIPPTALLLAVDSRNSAGAPDAKVVQALLDKGADPNLFSISYSSNDSTPRTPLAWAVQYDQPYITQLLLDKGADVHAHSLDGKTPLHLAIETSGVGTVAIVNALLAHGADVNAQDALGDTPLMAAVASYNNSSALVKLLLSHGANISIRNKEQETALVKCVSGGQDEGAKAASLLVAAGANVNDTDKDGNSTLLMSIFRNGGDNGGHNQIFQLLLSHGAKIFTAKDPCGAQLMVSACSMFSRDQTDYSMIGMLLMHGVNINARNEDGTTALLAAADSDVYEANSNVSPEDSDYMGSPALPGLMAYLLKHGANVNAQDKWGRTALMVASRAVDPKADLLLLAQGADVNARDKYGRTALMWAVEMGQTATTQALLNHGTDVTAQDVKGRTALNRARRGQFNPNSPFTSPSLGRSLMRLLQAHGAK